MNRTSQPTALTQIGHYQLLDSIGRGGMGLVFRARDTRLERDVAVKCLRTELFEAHYIERFKREALLLAKLNHPNIVQIYDFIEAPEQLALVMELVDGQNLQTYLREHIVPMSQRLHWLTQITEGLAIAHDAGIIHRDLKAENILINKRGQAKITDLGIAKSQDYNATLTDHVAGSYCSMSPEQAMGEAIDFKSDLFSLGILAYQLLCGAHPFGDTGNKLQIMQRIISHPPTPPHQHNPDLLAEFVDLLGQLLSKDPNKRPDNTHWVAAQFKKLSAMNVHDNIASDDTQALAIPQTNNTKSARTQDHPTFETRFVAIAAPKISLWIKLKGYIAANKIVVSSATVSLALIAGIIVWQLQPKPPKYVAVILPKLTAQGMQESQQELVKGAVYDAIQQSVVQLDGYYLIPREEITDTNGDNETVRKATAADELVVTEIQCNIETCTINISRLTAQTDQPNNRLRVKSTKTVDILADNYLAVAEAVNINFRHIYPEKNQNLFSSITEADYQLYLESSQELRTNGSSINLLKKLDALDSSIKKLPSALTLYREASLDLYHETKNPTYLDKISRYIESYPIQKNNTIYLHNLNSLQTTKKDFDGALTTINELKKINYSDSATYELYAHLMMAKGDYTAAIEHFNKAISLKKTATSLYNLSNAYWHIGNTKDAKRTLTESLKLSPNYTKSNSLLGLIFMLEGKIPEAIKSLESATIQNPKDIINLSNLGLCYLLIKNYDNAESLFYRASVLAPDYNTIKLNIADTKNLSGKTKESIHDYNDVLNSIPPGNMSVDNLRNAAQAYAHLGETTKALQHLKELVVRDGQNIETHFTAALVNALTNNKNAALFDINSALQQGMHTIWFSFPWFDLLCTEENFPTLMKKYGVHNRCTPDHH